MFSLLRRLLFVKVSIGQASNINMSSSPKSGLSFTCSRTTSLRIIRIHIRRGIRRGIRICIRIRIRRGIRIRIRICTDMYTRVSWCEDVSFSTFSVNERQQQVGERENGQTNKQISANTWNYLDKFLYVLLPLIGDCDNFSKLVFLIICAPIICSDNSSCLKIWVITRKTFCWTNIDCDSRASCILFMEAFYVGGWFKTDKQHFHESHNLVSNKLFVTEKVVSIKPMP